MEDINLSKINQTKRDKQQYSPKAAIKLKIQTKQNKNKR